LNSHPSYEELQQEVEKLREEVRGLRPTGRGLRTTPSRESAAQAETDEILRTIVDHIPVMIVFYEATGEIKFLNREAQKLLGFSLEEARRIDLMAHCYPDPDYRRELWKFMMEAPPYWRDIVTRGRGGEFFETSWFNVRLSNGSQLGIGVDISERKKKEKILESYNRKLELKNRELQDFAYAASHDLQEPLRKIHFFASLLHEDHADCFTDQSRECIQRIRSAAARMQKFIEGLLEYSRVAKVGNFMESVDLADAAREALSNLDARVLETRAEIHLEPLAIVEADPIQMVRLFQNLIGNSLKFHGPRTPCVAVRGKWTKGPHSNQANFNGRYYEVTIEDNGIGFDNAYADEIFVPFQKMHGRSEYDGVGIGLAICQRIVERHGGRIHAEGWLEAGAVFSFLLPARQGNRHENAHGNEAAKSPHSGH